MSMAADGCVVVIGGNRGIGREIAKHYADAGDEGRHQRDRCGSRAGGGERDRRRHVRHRPGPREARRDPRGAGGSVGPVRYLVVVAIDRDDNRIGDYSDRARDPPRHAEARRLHRGRPRRCSIGSATTASIVLFGGLAKDRPYPGSTTVSTVNGGIVGLVRTLVGELAPIRVNAIHPGIVGDRPFWSGKNLDHVLARTPTKRLNRDGRYRRRRALPPREPGGQRHRPARRRRLDDDVSA